MKDGNRESKFSNIYIMLLFSIMSGDMSRVRHFLSDELIEKYQNIIDTLNSNNESQMYDELNVKEIEILSTKTIDNEEISTVRLVSRYMDYVIDKTTGKFKRGINDHRIEKEHILKFKKSLLAKERPDLFKCPSCGNSLDINFNGTCSFCKKTVDLSEYDYILVYID